MSANPVQNNASLRMAEPAEVAGVWEIKEKGGLTCRLTLLAARDEAINGHRIEGDSTCLEKVAGAAVAGWRPAPDGIELVGGNRLTLVMFADQGDGTASAGKLALRRAAD